MGAREINSRTLGEEKSETKAIIGEIGSDAANQTDVGSDVCSVASCERPAVQAGISAGIRAGIFAGIFIGICAAEFKATWTPINSINI